MLKYQILIPAFNAANTLPILLEQIEHLVEKPLSILVIDDGSTDKTYEHCTNGRAKILKIEHNRGKGFALKYGIKYLINDSKAEYILFMDADLQHPVSSIPNFIARAEEKGSVFIIGKRNKSIKNMPLHRIISNSITSFIISILSGQKVWDSQCGFRLIHKDVLKKIKMSEDGFQFESEMLIRAAKKNVKLDFIQIPTIYNAEKSYIANFHDTYKFILLIVKELLKRGPWNLIIQKKK
jgi:glycosyltransferase involved in cell wall biosynthesis